MRVHHPGRTQQDRRNSPTQLLDDAVAPTLGTRLDGAPPGIRVPAGTPLPPGTVFDAYRLDGRTASPPPPPEPESDQARPPVPLIPRQRTSAESPAAAGPGRRRAVRTERSSVRRRAALLGITALALSTTTTAAVATPSPVWPKGVDISSWQHLNGATIDWNAVKAAGNAFAVIKATEATTYVNPQFAADKAAAEAAGLVVGAYHYARPALPISTAIDQANYFLAHAGNVRAVGQLAPVLDLEQTGGLNPAQLTTWTQTFLRTVEAQTGRTPILYTYRSFWTDKIANTQAFTKYPLWFALYNDNADPGPLPGGWPSWLIWQYDSGGAVNGITGRVDVNAFCCSRTDLAANANGTVDQIAARYATEPLLHISLGTPTRGEGPAGGGRWQPFTNGLMFWSAETGTRALYGPIARKYLAWGGSNGSLGRPLEDISWTAAPAGLSAVFEGGRIYWHPALGAFVVHGEILKKYLADGGSGSWLGLPTSDEHTVPGGRASAFQHGTLTWDATTNQVTESHNGTPSPAGTVPAAAAPAVQP
jgi:GH25 family lysozyme M1 (1,4-beta-N-acetylmuramidase)